MQEHSTLCRIPPPSPPPLPPRTQEFGTEARGDKELLAVDTPLSIDNMMLIEKAVHCEIANFVIVTLREVELLHIESADRFAVIIFGA